jgi:hypothetical protein
MDANVFYLYLWEKSTQLKYVIKRQISSYISLCKHQFMMVGEKNENSQHPLRQRFISIISKASCLKPGWCFSSSQSKCRCSVLNLVTTTSCRTFPTLVRVIHNLSGQLDATFISAIEKYFFVPIRKRQDGPQKRTGQVY